MTKPADIPAIRLQGRLYHLALPPLCPACGAPASVALRVDRVFARERRRQTVIQSAPRGVTTFHVASLNVPFCKTCAARHMAERAAAGAPRSLLRSTALMYGFVAAATLVVALFCGAYIANQMTAGWRPALSFAVSIAAGCTLFAGWFVMRAIGAFRAGATPPPTSITAAFEFSDNRAQQLEPEWREYRLRHSAYAQAFAQANALRAWNKSNPLFVRVARLRDAAGALRLVAVAALVVAFVLFALRAGGL